MIVLHRGQFSYNSCGAKLFGVGGVLGARKLGEHLHVIIYDSEFSHNSAGGDGCYCHL